MCGQVPRLRRMAIPAIWVLATAVAVGFAAWTSSGPVVLTFTPTHGVHLGDLVAAAGAYGGAAMVTGDMRRRSRRKPAFDESG